MTARPASLNRGDPPRALVLADAWLRGWGAVTLVGLVATAVLLASGADAWRPAFALSHLAALLALLPLGIVLVATHYSAARAKAGSALAAVRMLIAAHRLEATLTALAFLGVAITLSQFDGGVREVRRMSNLVTVAAVLALVVRYLRSGRTG